MKNEKCIILGKTGSGKDFLSNGLVKKGLVKGVKHTTRPKRSYENEGKDYYYISEEEFKNKIESGDFITYQSFETYSDIEPDNKNIWWYGLTREEYEKSNVIILTPYELKEFREKMIGDKLFVVYLDIPRSVRESRLNIRNCNNDSIKRRLDSDDIDFDQDIDFDLKVSDFTVDEIFDMMD